MFPPIAAGIGGVVLRQRIFNYKIRDLLLG
jgi:hypothetical protein